LRSDSDHNKEAILTYLLTYLLKLCQKLFTDKCAEWAHITVTPWDRK